MKTKFNVFEAKNAKAVSLCKSWLRASKIGYSVSQVRGADLVVTSKTGVPVLVQINSGDSVTAPQGATVLDGTVLTGRRVKNALQSFATFVAGLGYEPTAPVSRGDAPEEKLAYRDNFEEVSMRHTELRRCPNPSTEEMKKYDVEMKKATWHFLRTNTQLCADNMLEFEDLWTYAQVWIINYLGCYEVPEETCNNRTSYGRAYSYLAQRFNEFRTLLNKKGRNVFATLDVASIGAGREPYDYSKKSNWVAGPSAVSEDEEVDEAFVSRRREIKTNSVAARRTSAGALLDKKLADFSHDELVEVLTVTAQNDRIDPIAAREAGSRLNDHASKCAICSSKNVGVAIEEGE